MADETGVVSKLVQRGDDSKDRITAEFAESEFNRFIDTMDLDIVIETLDDEDSQAFEQNKQRIIRAICVGSLIVNDRGEPVFTPQVSKRTEPLTFHEPGGASLMAMDGRKKGHDVKKLFSVMGEMTRTNVQTFSNMEMRDLNICMAVTNLFLG